MAPFSITLNDPQPRFQGLTIIRRLISQKRYKTETQLQWRMNSYAIYRMVEFQTILNDP